MSPPKNVPEEGSRIIRHSSISGIFWHYSGRMGMDGSHPQCRKLLNVKISADQKLACWSIELEQPVIKGNRDGSEPCFPLEAFHCILRWWKRCQISWVIHPQDCLSSTSRYCSSTAPTKHTDLIKSLCTAPWPVSNTENVRKAFPITAAFNCSDLASCILNYVFVFIVKTK